MSELTDQQLTEWAVDCPSLTVALNCYTNRDGVFWIGIIFYDKETSTYYDADAGQPFSTELRTMLLEAATREAPGA